MSVRLLLISAGACAATLCIAGVAAAVPALDATFGDHGRLMKQGAPWDRIVSVLPRPGGGTVAVTGGGEVLGFTDRWRRDRRYGTRGRAVTGLSAARAQLFGNGVLLSTVDGRIVVLDARGHARRFGSRAARTLRRAGGRGAVHAIVVEPGGRLVDLIRLGSVDDVHYVVATIGRTGRLVRRAPVKLPDVLKVPSGPTTLGMYWTADGTADPVAPDGRGGLYVTSSPWSMTAIFRLRSDGRVDPAWGPDKGLRWINTYSIVKLLPWRGGVIALNGEDGAAWLDARGRMVANQRIGGGSWSVFAADRDGGLLVAVPRDRYSLYRGLQLMRVTRGGPDARFGSVALPLDEDAQAVAILPGARRIDVVAHTVSVEPDYREDFVTPLGLSIWRVRNSQR
jgi:hypothetical protein